jgi:AraC-like DNA-binding protein
MSLSRIRVDLLSNIKSSFNHLCFDGRGACSISAVQGDFIKKQGVAFISLSFCGQLLELAAMEAKDPLLGLQPFSAAGMELNDPLWSYFKSQSNLSNAIQYLQDNIGESISGIYLLQGRMLDKQRGFISIQCDLFDTGNYDVLRQLITSYLYCFINTLDFSDGVESKIHLVQMEKQSEMRGNVIFQQPFDGVSFPLSWLRRRLTSGVSGDDDQAIWPYDNMKYQYGGLTNKVTAVVEKMTALGEFSILSASGCLGMSVRTLQTGLKNEGESYSNILKTVRYHLATQLLTYRLSIAEISVRLGFSDVSVFSRSFKSWSGISPREWRKTWCTEALPAQPKISSGTDLCSLRTVNADKYRVCDE